jgi:hypothetical protein
MVSARQAAEQAQQGARCPLRAAKRLWWDDALGWDVHGSHRRPAVDIPEEVAAFVDERVHKPPVRRPDRVVIAVDEVLQNPAATPDRSSLSVDEHL